jgi:hypothetical protein
VGEFLSAEAILSQDTRPTAVVDVPEWGGAVLIRAFSKSQFIAMQKAAGVGADGEGGDLDEFQRQMFLQGVEDPKFTEDQVRAIFENHRGTIVDRVLVAIADLNALGAEAQKAMKAQFRGPGRK